MAQFHLSTVIARLPANFAVNSLVLGSFLHIAILKNYRFTRSRPSGSLKILGSATHQMTDVEKKTRTGFK
jgi:hypothetical protein